MSAVTLEKMPKLGRGVRLHEDRVRGTWVLLAPESMIEANPVAMEILKRCTGSLRVEAIVDELAALFNADHARIEADVVAFLDQLSAKRLVEL
ncbi:coenzyme PQQ synthesis protein D [Agaricicola taiwanensis]|uniref:Coenzyme PQQ synthesis protein D n=1 Tax=Agaricicola taiwanensis TaxID=591372 RepID=A0A8J3DZU5_9RHOB|nr:pyrroloquinoline quinone biosynthesis peptide chaperone PqqD [Agaricicola taiwanensis]GGE49073.1 coenzyme PQQ synthesis protein D [Agaricicola taiwanensis]